MLRILATIAAAWCLAAAPATATVFTATFQGKVSVGSDPANVFHLNGNLVGQNVVLTFLFDDSVAGAQSSTTLFPNRTVYELDGGGAATWTINGIGVAFPDLGAAIFQKTVYSPFSQAFSISSAGPAGSVIAGGQGRHLFDSPLIPSPFTDEGSDPSPISMHLQAMGADISTSVFTRVTVSVIPEPASWAMLLCGFGVVGGQMRRHRRRGAAPA